MQDIICQQLGFSGSVSSGNTAAASYAYQQITCAGDEPNLASCATATVSTTCSANTAVTVVCKTSVGKYPKSWELCQTAWVNIYNFEYELGCIQIYFQYLNSNLKFEIKNI